MHVLDLSLKQFLDKTNQERPEITGGCVLLTNASLTTAMILMALKISLKKNKTAVDRRFLKAKIKKLSSIQIQLAEAAETDLNIFDEYRKALRSKAKDRQQKLDTSLQKATDSLLGVCKVLNQAADASEASKGYTDASVLSDLIAGKLILEAVFTAIISLAEGNIESMPVQARGRYDRWKDRLEAG
jgi:formiminotetrahydrofolate cyclodeaminase